MLLVQKTHDNVSTNQIQPIATWSMEFSRASASLAPGDIFLVIWANLIPLVLAVRHSIEKRSISLQSDWSRNVTCPNKILE